MLSWASRVLPNPRLTVTVTSEVPAPAPRPQPAIATAAAVAIATSALLDCIPRLRDVDRHGRGADVCGDRRPPMAGVQDQRARLGRGQRRDAALVGGRAHPPA